MMSIILSNFRISVIVLLIVNAANAVEEPANIHGRTLYENEATSVEWYPGSVNALILRKGSEHFAIYRPADLNKTAALALTHARREVLHHSIAELIRGLGKDKDLKILASLQQKELWTDTETVWRNQWDGRFHNYAQQSSRLPVEAIPVTDWVQDGEVIEWNGFRIQVLRTPGYTRESVSYQIIAPGGFQVIAVGDMIQDDGKVPDLFSFQDEIPEAGIRGYHGYASRLAVLRKSLDKIMGIQPDVLAPARGELVVDPKTSVDRLKERIQNLYLNYISTNALYWYFKAPHIEQCVERMLGNGVDYQPMPYSHYEAAPEWILNHGTSRILVSDTGHAFLIDCGYDNILETIAMYQNHGVLKGVEGIFVTHYHDDHTDRVEKARATLKAPVYCLETYAKILKRPAAFRMPALTENGITELVELKHRTTVNWREYQMTFLNFPGQTLFHGAVLVQKQNAVPVLMVGDAFTPSGIDDYCLMNRNLMGDGVGYLYCLDLLDELASSVGDFYMLNQHVAQVFQWSEEQREFIRKQYKVRKRIIEQITPFTDANFAVDDNWARFDPYSQVARGSVVELTFVVTNHDSEKRNFEITWTLPKEMQLLCEEETFINLEPREERALRVRVEIQNNVTVSNKIYVVTASLKTHGTIIHAMAEALIKVE